MRLNGIDAGLHPTTVEWNQTNRLRVPLSAWPEGLRKDGSRHQHLQLLSLLVRGKKKIEEDIYLTVIRRQCKHLVGKFPKVP